MYKINDRVMVFDGGYWIIPATVVAIEGDIYQVEYDCGGYEWFVSDELRPLVYRKGDYVETMVGVGKVVYYNNDCGLVTVSYGKGHSLEFYWEFEVKPAPTPSLWTRLRRKDVYLHA